MPKGAARIMMAGDGEAIVQLCRQYGCGIEIQYFLDPERVEVHKKVLGDFSPRALHGPFGDLCAGSYDPKIREVTRDRFELACQFARQLESPDIILHHGYVPKTSPPDRWIVRCSELWREFLKDKEASLRFHVENMLEWDAVLLRDVIDAIEDSRVNVCLDIGHTHCNSKETSLQWIERLKSRIGWVHVHDNHGEWDEHLAPGRGTMPMKEVLSALLEHAPQAVWSLEAQDEQLSESMEWLASNGYVG